MINTEIRMRVPPQKKKKKKKKKCSLIKQTSSHLPLFPQMGSVLVYPPRWGSQFLANLLLKINVKVGGQNWRLEQQSTPQVCIPFVSTDATILFGADVSHPPPGADGAASLAAVVANGVRAGMPGGE